MSDVTIGPGNLAGKGIYAARAFKKGELVVPYDLKELSQVEFDALPEGEWEWTHTFWGKIYLFPEPVRYVNSDAHPTTYPDLDRMGDYASRDIMQGEAITINDKIELQNELDTSLDAYEQAVHSHDFDNVAPFIADEATLWTTSGQFNGKTAIREAFEAAWRYVQDGICIISNMQWLACNYWFSACTYSYKAVGMVNGKQQVQVGNGTRVVRRIGGRWRVVHDHMSKPVP
jgi:ketosteroid isomerase-like protein